MIKFRTGNNATSHRKLTGSALEIFGDHFTDKFCLQKKANYANKTLATGCSTSKITPEPAIIDQLIATSGI